MNATLTQTRIELAAPRKMPRGRTLRVYVLEAKYESLRMLRTPAFAGPFLLLPVSLYLLFAVLLFGAQIGKDPQGALYIFMGFSILGVMGPGMFGFGITVAMEREQGLLKLKRAWPMPPSASLIAKMVMSIVFVAIVMATMAAAAPLGHLPLTAGQLLSVSLVNIAGALPFCALGFLTGSFVSGKAAPAFVNLLYLPMIYLSGILLPLPKSMHWVALFSPAYHLDQLDLASIGIPSAGSSATHVLVLAGITIGFTAVAVRRIARVG
jgi:ABC-2 type transport system permease protein